MLHSISLLALALPAAAASAPAEFHYKDALIGILVTRIPPILKDYDPKTGRFGQGIWVCGDQNNMYPLAVAYATKADGNKYYKDTTLLDVIIKAGDALIQDMDKDGRWQFRKKDGSTWGQIYMPWTYSRWIRSFALIKDDMPQDRRKTWTKALTLGFTGISRSALSSVHNIPTHHAMGLYIAGRTLGRREWCKQATDFLRKVGARQAEGGYWSEHSGPVVLYNEVYIEALGVYYSVSKDRRVLPALEKAATFHYHFVYPNGHPVETIDERNPYQESLDVGNVGFTHTPIGRAYLRRQWARYGQDKLSADLAASLLLYGREGTVAEPDSSQSRFTLTEGGIDRAATIRSGPWFVCLSAYTAPIPNSRWIQDRQNLVSIYHDKLGLILGGGNTKLQPAWSNFTVGDPSLLQHKKGDTNPDFLPKGKLYHVPSATKLVRDPHPGLDLTYGPETCRIRLDFKDSATLEYRLEATSTSGLPVAAHLTLLPHMGQSLVTGSGQKTKLDQSPMTLTPQQLAGTFIHAGCKLRLPESASLLWPALPHNPYRKDGSSEPAEGRIEIRIPFDKDRTAHTVILEIIE